VKSDPFAPANSPLHPKNITAAALLGEEHGGERNRFAELLELHLTPHEQAANVSPSVEEAERRQTLVDEYREQLATEGPDAEAPELEDETGALYVWREGDHAEEDPEGLSGQPDGGTSSGWWFAGEPEEGDGVGGIAIPPRNGPGSDTDTWRAFAAQVTLTDPSQWATMTRGEIIAELENRHALTSEQA
jgi:hypothetical protein